MQTNKVESNDEIPGEDFLEKKDDRHKDLLQTLNLLLHDPKDRYEFNNQDKIANFAQEHYKTFIAAMQNGLPVYRFNQLKDKNKKALLNIIKQADKKGIILARYSNKVYLINTKDENNKTLNLINPKKIVVTAHPYINYNDFDNAGSQEEDNILHLYPLNNKFLSFISSRQTESVENTCRIINYFTKNQQMNVTLEGASQGVDFITKMVGSTHGKKNRIKNANINLDINAPHIFQDEEKIVKRLINGAKNNNTITNISVKNDMGGWKHPTCKTDNLIGWLKYYWQQYNNTVDLKYYWQDSNGKTKVTDLTDARSNKQYTLN